MALTVRKPRDTIKCLKDLEYGMPTDNPKRMADIAANYHEVIQYSVHDSIEGPNPVELESALGQLHARLSDSSKGKLSERTEEAHVREAIKNTNCKKAPGLDGIPIELWKMMDDQYQASEEEGVTDCKLSRTYSDRSLDMP